MLRFISQGLTRVLSSLTSNEIGDDGANALVEALMHENNKVEHLE